MKGKGQLTNLNLPASLEFLVVGGGPAIFCHILGSTFLVIFYSSGMWREMDKEERETGRCGFLSRICNQQDPIVAEIPAWEEESSSCFVLLFLFLVQVELHQVEAIDDQHISESAREQVRLEKDMLTFVLSVPFGQEEKFKPFAISPQALLHENQALQQDVQTLQAELQELRAQVHQHQASN